MKCVLIIFVFIVGIFIDLQIYGLGMNSRSLCIFDSLHVLLSVLLQIDTVLLMLTNDSCLNKVLIVKII